MTETKRINVEEAWDLVTYNDDDFTVWICTPGGNKDGVCLGVGNTELEALVLARLALFKLYKACPEPPRSEPK